MRLIKLSKRAIGSAVINTGVMSFIKITTSEFNALNDIIQGVSLVDIALTRNRGVKTITSHKINALKKLGVKSMSDLLVRR